MPPPSTPRRSSNRQSTRSTPSRPKATEPTSPLTTHDTNSVRDRIRQWQEQGGGVISGSDVDVENEDQQPSRTRTRRVKESTPKDSSPTQWSGRDGDASEAHDESQQRSHSAPRKRVVSDEHWRKVRSTSRTVATESVKKSRPVEGDDNPVTPAKSSGSRRRRRSGRRSSPRLSGSDAKVSPPSSTKKRDGSGTKASHVPNGKLSEDDEPVLQLSASPSEHDYSSSRKVTPEKSSPSSSIRKEGSGHRKRNRRTHETAERPSEINKTSPSAARAAARSAKAARLSKAFGSGSSKPVQKDSPASSAPPGQRLPSIEAWLEETPDPFIDEIEPKVEVPAPLKTRSRSRNTAVAENKPEDPNRIWESIETGGSQRRRTGGTGSRRRHRERKSATAGLEKSEVVNEDHNEIVESAVNASSKAEDDARDTAEGSPTPLRRTKATKRHKDTSSRTRQGESPLKDDFVEPKEEENVIPQDAPPDSPLDTLPFDFAKPLPLNLRKCPPTGGHRLSTIASVDTLRSRSELERQDRHAPSSSTSLPYRPNKVGEMRNYDGNMTGRGGGKSGRRSGGRSSSHVNDSNLPLDGESNPTPDDDEAQQQQTLRDAAGSTSTGLRRRLTTHADLISVLSLPQSGGRKSLRSARSIRTNRSRLATATISDLMQELATDETKYARELRTLVDGVIPVLLTCVLSKNDSSVAAGLFRSSGDASDDLNFTKPIVDMGIALERLKTLHKRIPQQDPDRLLTWAQGAQKVYSDYLKAWRLGFQDVVVNLAPANPDKPGSPLDNQPPDDGMDRDADGDVINGDGEKVDVAFLLKRPLVRLKYLSKTFKGINCIKPSASAADVSAQYQTLVDDARRRSNEERARLEDEAAANIDATRCRDLRTLGVLADVVVDKSRCVRARDYFNLALHHSSGQRVDCRSELLIRDNRPDRGEGGDVLICEVDESGKWLLFPPIDLSRVSARNGDQVGEIVVMIRGQHGREEEWKELLALKTEDEEAGFEWVQMLGLTPVPPKIERTRSFVGRHKDLPAVPQTTESRPSTTVSWEGKSRTPSPREIEVPIGEQASVISKSRPRPNTPKNRSSDSRAKTSPTSQDQGTRSFKQQLASWMGKMVDEPAKPPPRKSREDPPPETVRSPQDAQPSGDVSPSSLKRSKAKRISRHIDDSPSSPSSSLPARSALSDPELTPTSATSSANKPKSTSPPDVQRHKRRSSSPEPLISENMKRSLNPSHQRPEYNRSTSSVPSIELPTIPKLRKGSPPAIPSKSQESKGEDVRPSASPLKPKKGSPPTSPKEGPQRKDDDDVRPSMSPENPRSPTKLRKRVEGTDVKSVPFTEEVPPPPPHRSSNPVPPPHRSTPPVPPAHKASSPVRLKGAPTPNLTSPAVGGRLKRRSSSPLKHQYEPSTASESPSESEESTIDHHDISSDNELSDEEEELESEDVPMPLPPIAALRQEQKRSSPPSLPNLPDATLAPSNSASQAPYKTVPSQPAKSSKVIASIFTWSDQGCWQSLHDDECSIVITPGLIEAYEMSAAHSRQTVKGTDQSSELSSEVSEAERPLVAVELTPLVPLRRGTALDISIRSPPTDKSRIRSSNNIMFRSRNPEECEYLYSLINQSRINNPTYIALQNARGPFSTPGPSMGRHSTVRHGRSNSWFGLGSVKKGYRASSAPAASVTGVSESSVGSMASAFSALKRFGANSRMFNIARSTVTSRQASRAGSLYSSSSSSGIGSGSGSRSGSNTPVPSTMDSGGAIGLTNAKIRLYCRESASKWRDMGAARLTITKPPPGMLPMRPRVGPGSSSSPSRLTGQEKRIIINGKTKGEVLLDACLGESCFERVARTGIAVSVWEEMVGPNGEVGVVGSFGGVGATRARIYMLQMKSEAEAAYTFSLVGRLRY